MTLAKVVVTGIVYKAPKTGFTANNVAVSSFVLNIGTQDETLIRVISKRQALESVVAGLSKNQKVLVEGHSKTNENTLTGRTDGGKVVNFEGSDGLIGNMIDLEITEQRKWYLTGKIKVQ